MPAIINNSPKALVYASGNIAQGNNNKWWHSTNNPNTVWGGTTLVSTTSPTTNQTALNTTAGVNAAPVLVPETITTGLISGKDLISGVVYSNLVVTGGTMTPTGAANGLVIPVDINASAITMGAGSITLLDGSAGTLAGLFNNNTGTNIQITSGTLSTATLTNSPIIGLVSSATVVTGGSVATISVAGNTGGTVINAPAVITPTGVTISAIPVTSLVILGEVSVVSGSVLTPVVGFSEYLSVRVSNSNVSSFSITSLELYGVTGGIR